MKHEALKADSNHKVDAKSEEAEAGIPPNIEEVDITSNTGEEIVCDYAPFPRKIMVVMQMRNMIKVQGTTTLIFRYIVSDDKSYDAILIEKDASTLI